MTKQRKPVRDDQRFNRLMKTCHGDLLWEDTVWMISVASLEELENKWAETFVIAFRALRRGHRLYRTARTWNPIKHLIYSRICELNGYQPKSYDELRSQTYKSS